MFAPRDEQAATPLQHAVFAFITRMGDDWRAPAYQDTVQTQVATYLGEGMAIFLVDGATEGESARPAARAYVNRPARLALWALAACSVCTPVEAQNVRVWTSGFGMANSVFVQNNSGQDLDCQVAWNNANYKHNVTWGPSGYSATVTIKAGETWRNDAGYVTENERANCVPYVDPFKRKQPSAPTAPAAATTQTPAAQGNSVSIPPSDGQSAGSVTNPWAEQELNLRRQQLQLQQQQVDNQNRNQQQQLNEQRRANAAAEAARRQQMDLESKRLQAEAAERQRQQRIQEQQIREQKTQQFNNAVLGLGQAYDRQRQQERNAQEQRWRDEENARKTAENSALRKAQSETISNPWGK